MLQEFKAVKQEPGPGHRRWWGGDGLEFTVWYDEEDQFNGFQIAYRDCAFTWHNNGYWSHVKVGSNMPATPGRGRVRGSGAPSREDGGLFGVDILQSNGAASRPPSYLASRFESASEATVGEQIRNLVTGVLQIVAR